VKHFNLKESQAAFSKLEEKTQGKAFVILKRMCKKYGRWPSSFLVKDGIELEGSRPYAGGSYGEVWKARYNGKCVAVKAMRIFQKDKKRKNTPKQVRLPTLRLLQI
jgi:hypothetical protein